MICIRARENICVVVLVFAFARARAGNCWNGWNAGTPMICKEFFYGAAGTLRARADGDAGSTDAQGKWRECVMDWFYVLAAIVAIGALVGLYLTGYQHGRENRP